LKVPVYIAKRYLISKKSHNIINIISGIAVAGVTIGTMALIIILSVFNGFEKIVTTLFNSFDPDLMITVKEGKVFRPFDLPGDSIKTLRGVLRYTQVLEETALLKYTSKQYIVTMKGVSEDYVRLIAGSGLQLSPYHACRNFLDTAGFRFQIHDRPDRLCTRSARIHR
jgi:lipoprotein-releasing system permease protein